MTTKTTEIENDEFLDELFGNLFDLGDVQDDRVPNFADPFKPDGFPPHD